jgi:ATP-dependent helicase HrpB
MRPAWNDLPIAPLLPKIAEALAHGGALALQAETGAGKTTAVPAYLVSLAGQGGPGASVGESSVGRITGKIIVLEPRRLAAVAAAHRVSALLGEEPGGRAGYRVRGAVKAGPRTRVEFVTQAVFLRMIQDDPFVQDVGLVVFDEFHERTSTADLVLAFAYEAREARPDLSILVMSATMDTAKVAAFLGCPEMRAPGRAWPVEVRYQPPLPGEYVEGATARAIKSALAASSGDILAFLPGLREIRRLAGLLAERGIGGQGNPDGRATGQNGSTNLGGSPGQGRPGGQKTPEVLVLHGSLALEEQRRVISPEPGCGRRVVLATNVAETSLTVPGVAAVVDAGLSRFMGWHPRSGLNRLETGMVSVAEAEQRRGRAGRLGPGLCIRCWDEGTSLPASRGPEIGRSELASLVLECAARGIRFPEDLKWLDSPPPAAWEAGASLLADLGLTERGSDDLVGRPAGIETRLGAGPITAAGRKALSLGVDPRIGAALVAATNHGAPETARPDSQASVQTTILSCAIIGERDPDDFGGDGDFCSRLQRVLVGPGNERIRAILAEADRLAGRLGLGRFDPALARQEVAFAGELLASGFPDRLARLLPDGNYEFRSGRRARAVAELPRSDWILALDVDAGDPLGTIRQGAAVSTGAAHKALAPGARELAELEWRGLKAAAFERRRAGAFLLAEHRLVAPTRDALAAAVRDKLAQDGLSWLPWNEASIAFLARLRYAERMGVINLSAVINTSSLDDAAVGRELGEALLPYLNTQGQVLDEAALVHALEAMLEPAAVQALNRAAPAFVDTPGGRRRRPVYPSTGPARLAMRIQEAFGLGQVPQICGLPLVVELLSPADRPIQVTTDLASFWQNTYPTVRAELKRRYPKHYWPEDPLSAEPTRGLKPR